MIRFLLTTSALSVVVVTSAFAADLPVFPERKVAALAVSTVAPTGAQYRIRSGKSGVKFVACNEKRTYAGGEVELHCLSYGRDGWGKSLRWIPKYQLAGLTGAMPAEPVVTTVVASR